MGRQMSFYYLEVDIKEGFWHISICPTFNRKLKFKKKYFSSSVTFSRRLKLLLIILGQRKNQRIDDFMIFYS